MTKKSLRGFSKTRHFKERQKERQVSDMDIKRAIDDGSLQENEYGHNFLLGSLKVTVDLKNSTLITVHPGDPSNKKTKLMSKDEALKIKKLIEAHKLKNKEKEEAETNEFLKYVSDFSVKKI
jgi:hypothetical protein